MKNAGIRKLLYQYEVAMKGHLCTVDVSPFSLRHHCPNCGEIFCDKCNQGRIALTAEDNAPLVRICDRCLSEVTQRLSIAKEATNRSATVQSHEDLARKLKISMVLQNNVVIRRKWRKTASLQVRQPVPMERRFRFQHLAQRQWSVEYASMPSLSAPIDTPS